MNNSGSSATNSAWPVMVLAHNEAAHIISCLESIQEANALFEIFVMANGCTDDTEEIVKQYASTHPCVHLISLALGDKCHAWNVFIHETIPSFCPNHEVYFFMDGDARIKKGSLKALLLALQNNPYAHASSAIPASGRNALRNQEILLKERGLVANLYAMRGSFVEQLQKRTVKLPLGLEGDDGLIGALIKWNLQPESQTFDHQRIVPCAEAAFEFNSFSPLRFSDWKNYWKRAIRYGRRYYEFKLLGPILEKQGLKAMPHDIKMLYINAPLLQLRWQGLYTLTNFIALKKMCRIGKQFSFKE